MIVAEWNKMVDLLCKLHAPETMHYSLFMMLGTTHTAMKPCRRMIMDQLRDEG